jgi:drug/metabolite transporter (DMT)-like permease
MVPGIKKIIHNYYNSAWIPFILMVFFLLIASILVISGGLHANNPLNHPTDLFIKLYACSLLGQLYVSFCNFFGKGTTTGIIQLILFLVSLLLSFLTFYFLLVPFWKDFFGV